MKVSRASNEEWDQAFENSPDACFFQSRAWLEIWDEIYPDRKAICYKILSKNGEKYFIGGLEKKMFKGLIKRFDSGPEGTYGGFFSDKKIESGHIDELIAAIKPWFPFIISCFDKYQLSKINNTWELDVAYVVHIEKGQDNSLSYNRNTKRNIRKAEQHNLSVKIATDEEEWKNYYQMYVDNAPRWNKQIETLYPYTLFERIRKENRISKRLWLAFDNDHLLYGFLVFFHKNTAYAWHGSGYPEGLNKGAAPLLHHHIIRFCKDSGYKYYDLMTNGRKDSIHQFKSGLQPVEYNVFTIAHKNTKYRILASLSKLLHEKDGA